MRLPTSGIAPPFRIEDPAAVVWIKTFTVTSSRWLAPCDSRVEGWPRMKSRNLFRTTLGVTLLATLLGCASNNGIELGAEPYDPELIEDVAADRAGSAMPRNGLIRDYWLSWQRGDYVAMRRTLASDVVVDSAEGRITSADQFVMISKLGNPLRDVKLVADRSDATGGSIIYTATDSVTSDRYRVAEHVTIRNRKIAAISLVIQTDRFVPSVTLPASELAFAPFSPHDPSGPQVAFAFGAFGGPVTGLFVRTPAHTEGRALAPKHTHSNAYRAVVLEGVVRNGPNPSEAKRMGAGSYFSQAANEAHATECVSDTPCLTFVMPAGPFDFHPAE